MKYAQNVPMSHGDNISILMADTYLLQPRKLEQDGRLEWELDDIQVLVPCMLELDDTLAPCMLELEVDDTLAPCILE